MTKENSVSRPNYAAWSIEPLAEDNPDKENLYLNLVGWAILAASSHNVQPWKFILYPKGNTIGVTVDSQGVLPASDKDRRQASISIGCAVTNLLFAADYYGMDYEIGYFPECVSVEFQDAVRINKGRVPTLHAMKSRRMNRSEFDPTRMVPESILLRMRRSVENLDLTLRIITEDYLRPRFAELQYYAEKFALAHTDFRQELSRFLLPNDTKEGRAMPGNTFGLGDDMSVRVHRALAKDGIFDPGLANGMTATSRDAMKNSPVIGIIGVDKDNHEGWFRAGMALQEIALLAEMNNLGMAVSAAIVELFDIKVFGVKVLQDDFRKILPNFPQRPTVIFRMGYATEDRPHSPRVNVEEVVEVIK